MKPVKQSIATGWNETHVPSPQHDGTFVPAMYKVFPNKEEAKNVMAFLTSIGIAGIDPKKPHTSPAKGNFAGSQGMGGGKYMVQILRSDYEKACESFGVEPPQRSGSRSV